MEADGSIFGRISHRRRWLLVRRISVFTMMMPNTALEATPHSHCGFANERSDLRESLVRGASAFGR
jgi:hypothetical protein